MLHRSSRRWSEEEESDLLALYDKYQTRNKRFNIGIIPDSQLIPGRTRSAMAAKLLHDYQIRSVGIAGLYQRVNVKGMMALDFKNGMSKDDVIKKYSVADKVATFVMNNVDTVLRAEDKREQAAEKRHNFTKPRWSFEEDLKLMKLVNSYTFKDGTVNWAGMPENTTIGDRNFTAMQKRFTNHLRNKCEFRNGAWHMEVQAVISNTNPNRIDVVEEKVKKEMPKPTVPQPKPEPQMMTKSYLWGMITVTKPV